jgi:hypothetical protein
LEAFVHVPSGNANLKCGLQAGEDEDEDDVDDGAVAMMSMPCLLLTTVSV